MKDVYDAKQVLGCSSVDFLINLLTPFHVHHMSNPIKSRSVWPTLTLLLLTALATYHFADLQAQSVSSFSKAGDHSVYETLFNAMKDYELALAQGDSLAIADVCYRLGKHYQGLGDYKTAQQYFVRSLRIWESRNQYEAVGKIYVFMSNHQVEQKNYSDAIPLGRKAIVNLKKANSVHGLLSGNLAMASVHALGYGLHFESPGRYPSYSFDSALYYFQQAEKLALLQKVPADIANVYYLKGLMLSSTNPKGGIFYLKKAYALFQQEKRAYPLISISFILVDCYLALHQSAQASQWLAKAQYVIDTTKRDDYKHRMQLLQSYTRLYEDAGRWKDALQSYRKFHELSLKALNADRDGAITRIHIDYETQKKEAQIESQRQFIQIVIGICFATLVLSLIFYRFFRRYKQLSQQNAALVREQSHRVKNNFQELVNLLTLQSSRLTNEDAQKAVAEGLLRVEAMALLHQRLYYHNSRLVDINLESFIPDLVQGVLHSYSHEHIQPVYQLEPIWLHVDQALPLGLIINELVTNCCKYAFPTLVKPVFQVACQQHETVVTLTVVDNGPGFNPGKQYQSLGLKLIQAFVQRLDGRASFGLTGNTFQLSFPIHACQPIHLSI